MKRNFSKTLKFIGVKSVIKLKQLKYIYYWEWIIVKRINTRQTEINTRQGDGYTFKRV